MSRRLANIHFSGEIETRGLAAQIPQVHEGGARTAAPNMIWHIYSRLSFSKRDGGINFQSLQHTSPPPRAGPLIVLRRSTKIHFSGKIKTRGLAAQLPQVHEGGAWTAPDVI